MDFWGHLGSSQVIGQWPWAARSAQGMLRLQAGWKSDHACMVMATVMKYVGRWARMVILVEYILEVKRPADDEH